MSASPLLDARAVWLDASTLCVPAHRPTSLREPSRTRWTLHWSPSGSMSSSHLECGDHVAFELERAGHPSAEQAARHPQVARWQALRLPQAMLRSVPEMLTGQLLVERHRDGHQRELTGVQLGPVLDELYAAEASQAELGAVVRPEGVAVRVWAPTARRVDLLLWPADAGDEPSIESATRRMMMRSRDGLWTAQLGRERVNCRYLFEVTAYHPSTNRFETCRVTDPYSRGLTLNSKRSVIVDLGDPAGMPEGWANSHGPRLEQLVDASIYELHVRDFSISDPEVPEALRGSYLAFAEDGLGARHLRRLAEAGLNTVHLLPCFDITSINEDRTQRFDPSGMEGLDPAGHEQYRTVAEHASRDSFNWGYDPFHWMAPEGSYTSSNQTADGLARILEFRTMVDGLHRLGLRVVLDQVFTHTCQSGLAPMSVLDKVVPGYYYRLDEYGRPYDSTVENNTAMERVMATKMMVDACLGWARDHHVDGFRFDLMAHAPADSMKAVREALDELTLERDGVDGSQVYLYGEGWNFGEVANNALFTQASQGQLAGARVATFSDRLRDAVRGGRPFDEDPRRQGFGTGLYTDPNAKRRSRRVETALAESTDLVMLGLAGNLRDYELQSTSGGILPGRKVSYFGQPAGYATEPACVVSYVDAHDNETLWDALTLKLPLGISMDDRVRMNTLCLATATLAQTPVLWHAGADLLRSKSLDRNSYDSGDWFNRLDYTGADNGFGRGLPPAGDNMTRWRWLEPLLRDPALKPSVDQVMSARDAALDLLRLRTSTRLFRLGSTELIRAKVRFPVAGGPDAIPGVVAMVVDDRVGPDVDPELDLLLCVFNSSPFEVDQALPSLAGLQLQLHEVQQQGSDEVVRRCSWQPDPGVLRIPPRTVAVHVVKS